jgi:hypothetical protein
MNIVILDFETFFSSEYNLSNMTTEAYCRDSRFEAHGCAIRLRQGATADGSAQLTPLEQSCASQAVWFEQRQLPYVFTQIDWKNAFVIAHHMQFDGLILSHTYNVHPKMLGCTLSMARLLIGNHLSVSLESVRKHFGMPGKSTPYNLFRGKHWQELSPAVQQEIAVGACDEVESIWKIFQLLMRDFPLEELEVVDTTLKMFTEPVLRADVNLLAQVWEDENKRKVQALADLSIDPSELQSAAKFQALLEAEGVEIVYKDGKNGLIPAFAKTDEFMRELQEDDDPRVRALVEARLGAKSTLLQTRAETLGYMSQRGPLCVYLRYAGAHTTRWSGGDSTNFQNFKRGSKLRSAMQAPDGYILVKPDESQVECRLLNFLAGQHDVVENFRNGRDPYIGIASQFYGRSITKNTPDERGTGKQAELSCGYGCGPPRFKTTASLGIYGPPVKLSIEDAERFVKLYRQTHQSVVAYWRDAEIVIRRIHNNEEFDWGPMHIRLRRIYLPNGAPIVLDTLDWHPPAAGEIEKAIASGKDDWSAAQPYWRIKTRKGWEKLYGAKLVELTTQGLARVIISQAMIRVVRRGYRVVNSEHDSMWILIPRDGREHAHLQIIMEEMRVSPAWLPGIPLEVECNDLPLRPASQGAIFPPGGLAHPHPGSSAS